LNISLALRMDKGRGGCLVDEGHLFYLMCTYRLFDSDKSIVGYKSEGLVGFCSSLFDSCEIFKDLCGLQPTKFCLHMGWLCTKVT